MVTVNVSGNVTVENPTEPGRKTVLSLKGATISVTNPYLYGNGDYSSVQIACKPQNGQFGITYRPTKLLKVGDRLAPEDSRGSSYPQSSHRRIFYSFIALQVARAATTTTSRNTHSQHSSAVSPLVVNSSR